MPQLSASAELVSSAKKSESSILHWFGIELRPPGGFTQKLQFLTAAIVITCATYFADRAINAVYEFFFPDMGRLRAESVQNEIGMRVTKIEALSSSISSRLENNNSSLADALRADTEKLLGEIKALQPEIKSAGKIADKAQFLYSETKKADLQRRNFSTDSDFFVSAGQGATVCSAGYVFGITALADTAVSAKLSGGGGEVVGNLQPGGSLKLATKGGGFVQVGYQGKYGDPGAPRYGFSVNCIK